MQRYENLLTSRQILKKKDSFTAESRRDGAAKAAPGRQVLELTAHRPVSSTGSRLSVISGTADFRLPSSADVMVRFHIVAKQCNYNIIGRTGPQTAVTISLCFLKNPLSQTC